MNRIVPGPRRILRALGTAPRRAPAPRASAAVLGMIGLGMIGVAALGFMHVGHGESDRASTPAPATAPTPAPATDVRPEIGAPSIESGSWAGFFEPNVGQFDAEVRFVFTGRATNAAFVDAGVEVAPGTGGPGSRAGPAALRIEFIGGGRSDAATVGEDPSGPRVSYLIGRSPRPELAGIQTFERVRQLDVYEGVDVVWRASDDTLEYLIDAASTEALRQVRVRLRGARDLRVLRSGELSFRTRDALVRQSPPLAFASDDGSTAVPCRYRILSDDVFAFDVDGASGQPIVVDPVIRFSTLARGARAAYSEIRADAQGALFFAGTTFGSALEILGRRVKTRQRKKGDAFFNIGDAFVCKVDPKRARLEWVTFLGGRRRDEARDLAVGEDGSVFVVGETFSANFPAGNAIEAPPLFLRPDGFVTQLRPGGEEMAFSLYLSGVGVDDANAVALDSLGDCVVVGARDSIALSDFPCTCGSERNVRIVRIERDTGRLKHSVLIGGDRSDVPTDVAVGPGDIAYVVGFTNSPDFPVTVGGTLRGGGDGFILAVTPTGETAFARLIGGSGGDSLRSCAIAGDGMIHMVGATQSRDLPTLNALQPVFGGGLNDVLIACVDPLGELRYVSYLGGLDQDLANGVAIDAAGDVYVCGFTGSDDFPTESSFQTRPAERPNAFVARLRTSRPGLEYSVVFGGRRSAGASGIAVIDEARVAVCGGSSVGEFPLVSSVGRSNKPQGRSRRPFLMVIDESGPPETAHLELRAGKLRAKDFGVSGHLRGTLRPVAGLSDGVLDPASERVEIEFVAGDGQALLTIDALDPRWKSRGGNVLRWKGTFVGGGTGTVKVNTQSFRFSAAFDDVPVSAALADLVRVRVRIGDDESVHQSEWTSDAGPLRFGRR